MIPTIDLTAMLPPLYLAITGLFAIILGVIIFVFPVAPALLCVGVGCFLIYRAIEREKEERKLLKELKEGKKEQTEPRKDTA